MSDVREALGPGGWIAFVAFVIGAAVRLLRADKLNAVLEHFSIPKPSKKLLPWAALVLGFGSTFFEAKLAGASWTVAALAGCWGTVSGGLAVAGHETLGPLAAKVSPSFASFVFGTKPKPVCDPVNPSTGCRGCKGCNVTSHTSGFGGFPLAVAFVCMALVLMPTATGCAAIVSALPTVIAAVQDAALILDAIEDFADAYFARHPDEAKQAKINAAIGKSRTALSVALRASEGSENLTQAEVDQAFAKFRAAYAELSSLLAGYGMAHEAGAFAASTEQIEIPHPLALSVKVPK